MERVAVNLADAFADSGHDSHLMVYRRRDEGLEPENPNVTVHVFPIRWLLRLTGIGWIIELISRLFLNVFIRKSHFVWVGWIGGLLLHLWVWCFERRYGHLDRIVFRGIGTFELVWSYRDHRARFVLESTGGFKANSALPELLTKCLFSEKHLVAVSEGVARSARQAQKTFGFEPASLSVIVNPCPISTIRRLMVANDLDIPSEPYIVNVARLVAHKDHELLLRSYKRAAPSALLVLVGDGPMRQSLEHLAHDLGIADKVQFVGHRNNPYPWMRHARLFVLSSRFEGMGIVLTEALACGTPVVSVDCPGGIREVMKGELENSIAARNEVGLAHQINVALSTPNPTIKETWLEDFQPQRVVEKFLA